MKNSENAGFDNSITYKAKLLSSKRITPETSREEVRQLVFSTDDIDINGTAGSCIHVLAPGQYGNKHHSRLYSIADHVQTRKGNEFELCVRRCFYVDEVSGEEYDGVASNYLCNLQPGSVIEFSGPVGYPFAIPNNPNANLLMIGMGTGIAPFRGLIRMIYEKYGSWKGKVRLFHGARTGSVAIAIGLLVTLSQADLLNPESKKQGTNDKAIPVKVALAVQRDTPNYLSSIGTVQALNTVLLRSRVDGEINRVLFQEGKYVKRGDVLVELDLRPFEV